MIPQAVCEDDEPALYLQVEPLQATSPAGATSRKRRLLWTGFGFVGLIVIIGISTLSIRADSSPVSGRPSRPPRSVAFNTGPKPMGSANLLDPKKFINKKPDKIIRLERDYEDVAEGLKIVMNFRDILVVPRNHVSAPTAGHVQVSELLDGGWSATRDPYTLRVPQLKALLRHRGLPVSGKRAELLERLEIDTEKRLSIGEEPELIDAPKVQHRLELDTEKSVSSEPDLDLPQMEGIIRTADSSTLKQLIVVGTPKSGELYKFKVTQLKAILRERGLPVSGTKAELLARLLVNMEEAPDVVKEASDPPTTSSPKIEKEDGANAPFSTQTADDSPDCGEDGCELEWSEED